MDSKELKDMDIAKLQKLLAEKRGELQQQRFDVATMKLTKVHTVAQTRKQIAQILTEITKRNTSLNNQA